MDYFARTRQRKADGKCVTCGSKPARENHSDCARCYERTKTYHAQNREKIYARRKEWYEENREEIKERSRLAWKTRRHTQLDRYGGVCVCCNEKNKGFLSFDHADNSGKSHRDKMGSGGRQIVIWLERHDIQPEIRVLCYNCNMGRQFSGKGICPHED